MGPPDQLTHTRQSQDAEPVLPATLFFPEDPKPPVPAPLRPPSSPASAGGAESGSLPIPGPATRDRVGQRGLRGGRPWLKD